MKKINLGTLDVTNFKGIKKFSSEFSQNNDLIGDNGTGKTSIFDAFFWLLFSKDSHGVAEFGIRPRAVSGSNVDKLDIEVRAGLEVHHELHIEPLDLKKIQRQKWTVKKGTEEAILTGSENLYFINDVPMKEGDYKAKISAIFDENLFRLVTSPTFFNSLHWETRRTTLLALAGDFSNEEVAKTAALKSIVKLIGNKSLKEFKAEIAYKIAGIKKEIELIPARIDEVNRQLPAAKDWAKIEKQLLNDRMRLAEIEGQLSDEVKKIQAASQKAIDRANRVATLNKYINDRRNLMRDEIDKFNAELRSKIRSKLSDIKVLNDGIAFEDRLLGAERTQMENLEMRNGNLRRKYNEITEEQIVFDTIQTHCPTCKQALPEDQIATAKDELQKNYNTDRVNHLQGIQANGKANAAEIDRLKASIEERSNLIGIKRMNVNDLETEIADINRHYPDIHKPIDQELNEAVRNDDQIRKWSDELVEPGTIGEDFDPKTDSPLEREKTQLLANIKFAEADLIQKQTRDILLKRLAELGDKEKSLAQQLADLQKQQFSAEALERARMNFVEEKINGKFTLARFKMFRQLINGGSEPCCECIVEGVDYSDLNTASKINAGVDIINALSAHYGISGPMFIDNRESVLKLIPTDSQTINLKVVADQPLQVIPK